MRLCFAIPAIAIGMLCAQDSVEVTRAQQEIGRLRELVAAGAIAPARLAEAEQRLGDARDDEVLRRTLYGKLGIEELTPDQSSEMIAAAQRRLARQQERIDQRKKLLAAGVIGRGEITALEDEMENRRLTVELALSRAKLLEELAEAARREKDLVAAGQQDLPVVVHRAGDHLLTPLELKALEAAFEKKFRQPLPISANGESETHRAMGFDHRGRVDVAVVPDDPEGVWLLKYLDARAIPYFAFRAAVRGQATGAHIHIGPGSTRLRPAD